MACVKPCMVTINLTEDEAAVLHDHLSMALDGMDPQGPTAAFRDDIQAVCDKLDRSLYG